MERRTIPALLAMIACIFAVSLLAACSDDDNPVQPQPGTSEAPALPAISTMAFTLDFFGVQPLAVDPQSIQTGRPGPELEAADTANRTNWINALVRVLYLKLLVYDAIEEPVGAFALAIHSVPQKQSDGGWLWTYIFVGDGVEYSVFLYGKAVGDRADWRLEVSTNAPEFRLEHFVWFTGQSMLDGTDGYWQFYEPILPALAASAAPAATDGIQTARIDWEHASPYDHRLTVTINKPGDPDEGDTLEFHESLSIGEVNHYDAGEARHSNITWYPDGTGSITVWDYNNGETACWDEHQQDTVCPVR
jgi:hypothetical protein